MSLKVIAGTDQPCRRPSHPGIELPLVDDAPSPPDWLPNMHAVKEWHRLVPILRSSRLLTEAGLSALAHLCALQGRTIQLYFAGETPAASTIAQVRAWLSDFGLTPASREKVLPTNIKSASNRFSSNGKRSP
jgi:phage terminase small subunit